MQQLRGLARCRKVRRSSLRPSWCAHAGPEIDQRPDEPKRPPPARNNGSRGLMHLTVMCQRRAVRRKATYQAFRSIDWNQNMSERDSCGLLFTLRLQPRTFQTDLLALSQ